MAYEINHLVGKKIAYFRNEKLISQEDLAFRLRMHPTTISRIERGISNPSINVISRIAHELDIPLSKLFEHAF